ncbi:hypothetical protein ACVBGC_33275 [Burkholderia stagnalis]
MKEIARDAAAQPRSHWDFALERACASASAGVMEIGWMGDGAPLAHRVAATLRIAGHTYRVNYICDVNGVIRREHVLASGIACVWLAALNLFGDRFMYSKPTAAAFELQAWFEGAGAHTQAGRFVRRIEKHLIGLVAGAAVAFDAEHRVVDAT